MNDNKGQLRKRSVFLVTAILMTCVLWILTDPSLSILKDLPFGSGLISNIVVAMTAMLGIGLLYLVRKNLMDYEAADFKRLGERAYQNSSGAGLFAIAVAIKTLAYAIIIAVAMM